MFDVSISVESNSVMGVFVADSYFFEPSKYDYAFYLCKDGEKISSVWYSNSMEANFDLKDMTGLFYIKVFVRDIEHGDRRVFDSKKILVNE